LESWLRRRAAGHVFIAARRHNHLCDFGLASGNDCVRMAGMNGISIAGIVMIVAGGALLAYGGFTTTKRENVIDLGPLKVQADVKERHSVPPVLSWALLGGGVVVLVLGMKKK
jgi:hypothetical protein